MKVVVTGHDDDGKAVFTDDRPQQTLVASGFPGLINSPLWTQETVGPLPSVGRPDSRGAFFPPDGGLRFFILTIAGEDRDQPGRAPTSEQLDEAEELFPGLFTSMEPEPPGMHRSDSVDLIVILSGTVVLELDDAEERVLSAGDAVVQNGTRHRWRNESAEPVSLAITMIGTRRV